MNSKSSFRSFTSVRIAKRWFLLATALMIAVGAVSSSAPLAAGAEPQAQTPTTDDISPSARAQIAALLKEKAARSPVQRKIDSQLLHAQRMALGQPVASGVQTLEIDIPRTTDNRVILDVRANVDGALLRQLEGLGAEIVNSSARYGSVRLQVDLNQIEAIAALPEVIFVLPKQEATTSRADGPGDMVLRGTRGPAVWDKLGRTPQPRKRLDRPALAALLQGALNGGGVTQVGSRNSEGDKTHRADFARTTYHIDGTGVKIGVLSDGVTNLAASQAAGDLGPVTVLSGQTGSGDEGTAMLEIIHDLAPGAQLYFATAFSGVASFAQNIRNLRAAGCDIIVDDVSYSSESPFQDGQAPSVVSPTNGGAIAQAVKDVAASGALYFSSAANSGNLNAGTSGTWEGNFVDGGPVAPPVTDFDPMGRLHNFGGQNFDSMTRTGSFITLFWADPLGAPPNDYDLFRLDSTGATVLNVSNNDQTSFLEPIEAFAGANAGDRIVIVLWSGSARFLHLDTSRGRLSIATTGSTHGHAATSAPNSFGVAATPAVGPYPNPFNSSNVVETFSSDGPRRIFFTESGAAITPGNFTSTGGQVLNKPDLTAADGVSVTGVGGFPSPFFGTSAAAPHAAAIAALIKSAKATLTASQIRSVLLGTAIDIEAAGVDRDSGVGIVMADRALAAVVLVRTRDGDFDGDGRADITVFRPSTGGWHVLGSGTNLNFTWGGSGDIPVPGDYDGDGRIDPAVFRPSTGTWYILRSASSTGAAFVWGVSTDIPVPGDYDGDGKTDVAIFRPSTGIWYVLQSRTGIGIATAWGASIDKPVPADYDGDGKTDIAIFRPSTGIWYIVNSATSSITTFAWGGGADIPVQSDYDGDGRADVAVFRPSTGIWYILRSASSTGASVAWGASIDTPVPGDYDGDGKTDVAVFRASTGTWYILRSASSTGTSSVWGVSTDIPVLKRP